MNRALLEELETPPNNQLYQKGGKSPHSKRTMLTSNTKIEVEENKSFNNCSTADGTPSPNI